MSVQPLGSSLFFFEILLQYKPATYDFLLQLCRSLQHELITAAYLASLCGLGSLARRRALARLSVCTRVFCISACTMAMLSGSKPLSGCLDIPRFIATLRLMLQHSTTGSVRHPCLGVQRNCCSAAHQNRDCSF